MCHKANRLDDADWWFPFDSSCSRSSEIVCAVKNEHIEKRAGMTTNRRDEESIKFVNVLVKTSGYYVCPTFALPPTAFDKVSL